MCKGVAPPVLISFTKSGNLSSKGLMALGPRRSALLIGVYPPPAYTGPGFELCPYKIFESFKGQLKTTYKVELPIRLITSKNLFLGPRRWQKSQF